MILLSFMSNAQTDKPLNERFEMKEYFLVFLKKGPSRSQDSATVTAINREHLAYLTKMYNEDKMSMCGPLMDDTDILGIAIYHVDTADEAKKLAESDPAVKAGRIAIEVHPWYSAKGMILK